MKLLHHRRATCHHRNTKSHSSGPVSTKQVPSITEFRGTQIASAPGQIRRLDAWRYKVRSQSTSAWYNVIWHKKFWKCDCPFNRITHQTCKHIYAVLHRITDIEIETSPEACPECHRQEQVVRRGYYKSRSGLIQRYQCKQCHKKFTARTSFRGMKYSANIVTTTLDLFFKGVSLRSLADHINQFYGYHISHVTVYRWIRKFLQIIVQYAQRFRPTVSHKWHVDETKLRVNGKLRNFWNLMDHKTRYLLAIQVTSGRSAHEAKALLSNGLRRADTEELVLISDGLASYRRATNNLLMEDSDIRIKHIADSGLSKRQSNNRLERFHGTVKERTKTMRGLDSDESSQVFAENFAAYYNYLRPHTALNGKTPGQVAKVWRSPNRNRWFSLIEEASSAKS